MKIGIITDGQGEPAALDKLRPKLDSTATVLRPLYADMQPKAAPGQIARKAVSRVRILENKGVDRIIVIIDREDHADCAPDIATRIEGAFRKLGHRGIQVVVKDRTFENWLIADPGAIKKLRARFSPKKPLDKMVSPNKADSVHNAEATLNTRTIKKPYHKRNDPPDIMGKMDVSAAAMNSRSFRRFLHLLGDRRYKGQSKKP